MEVRKLLSLPFSLRASLRIPSASRPPYAFRGLSSSSYYLAPTSPNDAPSSTAARPSAPVNESVFNSLTQLSGSLGPPGSGQPYNTPGAAYRGSGDPNADLERQRTRHATEDEHHLHIYAHRRNTHLTLTDQKRNSIISISTGNLGFRKAQRGTYDAAFQLAAYMLTRMQQQGLMAQIHKLEVLFRGFGPGRDAVTKVLMGVEGIGIRKQIIRVVDKTRLKIGGTRSPKPRRLG